MHAYPTFILGKALLAGLDITQELCHRHAGSGGHRGRFFDSRSFHILDPFERTLGTQLLDGRTLLDVGCIWYYGFIYCCLADSGRQGVVAHASHRPETETEQVDMGSFLFETAGKDTFGLLDNGWELRNTHGRRRR